MKTSHTLLLLGAVAGAVVCVTKMARASDRGSRPQSDAGQRSSIDDVPTVSPAQADVDGFDDGIAPAAPF